MAVGGTFTVSHFESAYGRTPFFEFYIDRFAPFLCAEAVERYPFIIDLDAAIDAVIREILLLPPAPVFNAVAKEEGGYQRALLRMPYRRLRPLFFVPV